MKIILTYHRRAQLCKITYSRCWLSYTFFFTCLTLLLL